MQIELMAFWLALASWKLVVHEGLVRRDRSPRFPQRTGGVRGYVVSRREDIAGVVGLDGAVTRAADTSLGRGEGYDCRDHGKRQQLLGEEHISVLMRVGAPTGGEERGRKCLQFI